MSNLNVNIDEERRLISQLSKYNKNEKTKILDYDINFVLLFLYSIYEYFLNHHNNTEINYKEVCSILKKKLDKIGSECSYFTNVLQDNSDSIDYSEPRALWKFLAYQMGEDGNIKYELCNNNTLRNNNDNSVFIDDSNNDVFIDPPSDYETETRYKNSISSYHKKQKLHNINKDTEAKRKTKKSWTENEDIVLIKSVLLHIDNNKTKNRTKIDWNNILAENTSVFSPNTDVRQLRARFKLLRKAADQIKLNTNHPTISNNSFSYIIPFLDDLVDINKGSSISITNDLDKMDVE